MNLLLTLVLFLIPKFDMALTSHKLYAAFNNVSDPTCAKATKTYTNKTLLVRGWYGGRNAANMIILEIAPNTQHNGFDYVVADMNDYIAILRAKKNYDDTINVLCQGNGYEMVHNSDGKVINRPLLTNCELIK